MKQSFPRKEAIQDEVGLCLLKPSDIAADIYELKSKYPQVSIQSEYDLGVTKIKISTAKTWKKVLQEAISELKKKFSTYFFQGKLEVCLQDAFMKNKKTLILGESCTGGKMASLITSQPGSSAYFLGSVVCYANSIKEKILQVKPSTIQEKGAVSKETVKEMLEGLFRVSSADYAVAISGVAGPGGGGENKPVGTVFVGFAKRDEPYQINTIFVKGTRAAVITETVYTAFSYLYRKLEFAIDTKNE